MKHNEKYLIYNKNTYLTTYEIFDRINAIFRDNLVSGEEKQMFSFRDGVVATFVPKENGYTITFEINLKYKCGGEKNEK